MKILILGATGFIGSAIASRLVDDGHKVTGLGRQPDRSALKQPRVQWLRADLSKMIEQDDWSLALADQEIVVNCAGALQDGLSDNLMATQAQAMLALYKAAKPASLKLIVQISAQTSGAAADLPFLATKRRADEALYASGVPYVILRPALVVGRNAHGGSALLRALAALPFAIPLIDADKPVRTIWMGDVAAAVAGAVSGEIKPGADEYLSTGKPYSLGELVLLHRQWLGLPPVPLLSLPKAIAKPVTWLADAAGRLGWRSPLRSTAMAVMSEGVHPDIHLKRRSAVTCAAASLFSHPSGVQDLWFARLYLLKPVVIGGLSIFWLLSGLVPLIAPERAAMHFHPFMPPGLASALTLLTCLADIILGLGVIIRPFARKALVGMLGLSVAYLCGATLMEPALWGDPLGPLVKVIPSTLLTLVALATLDER